MITHRARSLYTVPISAVNGLSRLTTTSNGQTRPIRKFSNRPITVESNRNGRFEFESNLEASQVPTYLLLSVFVVGPVIALFPYFYFLYFLTEQGRRTLSVLFML